MEKCDKIQFNSAQEARDELFRIVEDTTYKPWKTNDKGRYGGHKPSRFYKCPICSTEEKEVWHLTSSTKIIDF